MKVSSIRLRSFRSFVDSGEIMLDQMNVVVGRNNSGKSSILRGLHQLQEGLSDPYGDVRIGLAEATVNIKVCDSFLAYGGRDANIDDSHDLLIRLITSTRRDGHTEFKIRSSGGSETGGHLWRQSVDPHHFIVPYYSKRKAVTYQENTSESAANAITSDVSFLAAKLARIGNPAYPKHEAYAKACKEILGFVVAAIPSPGGQRPGIYMPDGMSLPIEQMGEGVPNIVQLLVSLASFEGKLFLLEEPENDLHPAALKSLLDLVVESGKVNQFVVSTHSNIVVRHLCGIPNSKLFRITADPKVLPTTARVEIVEATPEARLAVLEDLGYSFADFELWDGWLILEEASAKRIVRDYLIPWFAPRLRRVRTFSANGVNNVEPVFADFQRMVVYTHLMPIYRGRTWVRVDGDLSGIEVIEKLKSKFKDFPSDRFISFNRDQFEKYYPKEFSDQIGAVLAIADTRGRRTAKRDLLLQVLTWLDENEERGKVALSESAAEVIADLKTIEAQLGQKLA